MYLLRYRKTEYLNLKQLNTNPQMGFGLSFKTKELIRVIFTIKKNPWK